jgi:Protein of unknown function (DUF3306)
MGALEKFVSRWSRLKRASESRSDGAAPATAGALDAVGGDEAAAKRDSARRVEPPLLPSLESITAATDVRAFLQSTVPVELTRAALRRTWVSDPRIRDFVGIAENQWDFTNPTAIPGFGPLSQAANEAGRIARAGEALDRSLSQVSVAHPTSAEAPTPGSDSRRDAVEETVGERRSTLAVPTLDKKVSVLAPANCRSEETASPSRENLGTGRPRRAHGSALPR